MRTYSRSCHCGEISFVFSTETSIAKGTRCNCSFCEKLGIVYSDKIDPLNFKILKGQDSLKVYLFNDKVVRHSFCRNCGVYVFYTGVQCKINLGCVNEIDTFSLPVEVYDGKHLL